MIRSFKSLTFIGRFFRNFNCPIRFEPNFQKGQTFDSSPLPKSTNWIKHPEENKNTKLLFMPGWFSRFRGNNQQQQQQQEEDFKRSEEEADSFEDSKFDSYSTHSFTQQAQQQDTSSEESFSEESDLGGPSMARRGRAAAATTSSNRNSQGDGKKVYVRFLPSDPPTRTEGPDPVFNVVYVNDDDHPVLINNEHFTGQAVFRVKDYDGWTPLDERTRKSLPIIPDTPYFEGHRRTFSFQISGRFRKSWTANDIMFGTFFSKPLSLPRGYSLALSIAKKIDPSMVAVLDVPEPYMCSPLICAMNTAHIQPLYAPPMRRTISAYRPEYGLQPRNDTPLSLHEAAMKAATDDCLDVSKPLTMPPWEYGKGKPILEENIMLNWPSWTTVPTPTTFYRHSNSSLVKASSKVNGRTPPATIRRNWFLDESHRKKFIYHPDTVYSFDFASPYVDLCKMKLKLGLTIDVEPYLGDQPIRYECRTRDGSVLFWAVEIGRR